MRSGSWALATTLSIVGEHLFANATEPVNEALAPDALQSLPYGTGAGCVTHVVAHEYTLGVGASVTLDLYDGSLADVFGVASPLRVLRGWAIWVHSGGDTSGVTVGNAGSNPHPLGFGSATYTKSIYPGGAAEAGGPKDIAVTATVRNVKIQNASAVAAVVRVFLGGSSTASGEAAGPPGIVYP
jgi:hypothetical protein